MKAALRSRPWLRVCLWVALAAVGTYIVVTALLVWAWNWMHRPYLDLLAQVTPGITEQRVTDLIGEPVYVWNAETTPPDWYERYSGSACPKWHIENKVLKFSGPGDYVVFVHIGDDGKVKEKFVGGT
jgi:hypothetical protein